MTPLTIKLCGMSRPEDILAANSARPDYLGIVIGYPASPRSVSASRASELAAVSQIPVVAVVVDPESELVSAIATRVHASAIQLSGGETPEFVSSIRERFPNLNVWKVLRLPFDPEPDEIALVSALAGEYAAAGASAIMVDAKADATPGGSGQRTSWASIAAIRSALSIPVILAGGLSPTNVAEAIATACPDGVDVSSGIERAPGLKHPQLMSAFVIAARKASGRLQT
jgi:phosphoribosylanthranilate isomerase